MSEITTLLVLRHGNTFNSGDVICRVGSRTNLPLTETGMGQGTKVGEWLLNNHLIPSVIYSAPLLRTKQSATAILKILNVDIPVLEEPLLTELDYGIDDGKPEDEVLERLGRVAGATGNAEMCRQRGKEELKRWDSEAILPIAWQHLSDYVKDLPKRWRIFGNQVIEKHAGKLVVAVTSNGIARFSRAILPKGTSLEQQLKLSTGAFGLYRFIDGEWNLGEWNLRP